MFPEYCPGTKLVIDINKPVIGRGDPIVIKPPSGNSNNSERLLLKRVIALEGDTIEIIPAQIFVNGKDTTSGFCRDLPLHAKLREIYGIKESCFLIKEGKIFSGGVELSKLKLSEYLKLKSEDIELVSGKLILNNIELKEEYVCEDPDYEINAYIIPKNKIFLLGDNRNRSIDSHIWFAVNKNFVVGKVILKRD